MTAGIIVARCSQRIYLKDGSIRWLFEHNRTSDTYARIVVNQESDITPQVGKYYELYFVGSVWRIYKDADGVDTWQNEGGAR